MVKLFCAIVGTAGSAFPVVIDDNKLVGHLKKAIKEESEDIKGPAKDLQLFLAKKDDAWLDGAGAAAVMVDGDGRPQGFEQMDPMWTIEDVLNESGLAAPKSRQVHVLVVVPDDPSGIEKKRKRKRMDDAPDAWMKALKDEHVEVLPSTCADLKKHLERGLRVKVPISERLFQLVSVNNTAGDCTSTFDKLFEPEPRESLSDRTIIIVANVVDPQGSGSKCATKETYHHLWDSLIAALLRRVSNGRFLRYTKNTLTSTGLSRPDLCFYCNNSNVCVFRGEEKASGDLEVPIKELHEKLHWRYDTAPYVFGYAVVGLRVCLVAILKDEITDHRAKAETIETYNLGDLNDRLAFFLALLNLSTLFHPVVDLIKPLGIPEYGIIKKGNGVQIAFAEDCVVKTYPSSMPSDTIIHNLKTLHRLMKIHSVPNVVELKKTHIRKKHVMLAPVGRLSPPEKVHQLLTALRDILKALRALHAINLMHRDLRWENVLKYPDEGDKWFLIDFDDAAQSPAAQTAHFNVESHAPEIALSSSHTVEVDIWSVGFLLKTSTIADLPAELKAIKKKCLQKRPSKRPTAESLLNAIEAMLESSNP